MHFFSSSLLFLPLFDNSFIELRSMPQISNTPPQFLKSLGQISGLIGNDPDKLSSSHNPHTYFTVGTPAFENY